MIAKWAFVALFVIGALSTVSRVGKPRNPIEPAEATVTVLLNALAIAAIVIWWEVPA